jgi:hypothetical protein
MPHDAHGAITRTCLCTDTINPPGLLTSHALQLLGVPPSRLSGSVFISLGSLTQLLLIRIFVIAAATAAAIAARAAVTAATLLASSSSSSSAALGSTRLHRLLLRVCIAVTQQRLPVLWVLCSTIISSSNILWAF